MHCCRILLNRASNVEEHPCHALLPFDFEGSGIDVRILSCSMMDESSGYSMIRIRDPAGSVEEGRYEFEYGEASITKLSSNTYMAMVTNRRCLLSSLINRLGCFLLSAVPRTDTLIEWTLVGPT